MKPTRHWPGGRFLYGFFAGCAVSGPGIFREGSGREWALTAMAAIVGYGLMVAIGTFCRHPFRQGDE
jgi:biotin transporter BioY